MNYRVVVDTNILVSYLLPNKKLTAIRAFMDRVLRGDFELIVSKEIMQEYEDVLHRRKFGFLDDSISELLDFFQYNSIFVEAWDTGVELADSGDLPFFEAYIAEQSPETFLVTGNTKHFPEWPYIVTPSQIIKVLE